MVEVEKICKQYCETQSECQVVVVSYVLAVHDASLVGAVHLHGVEGHEHNVADQTDHVVGDGHGPLGIGEALWSSLVLFRQGTT